MSTNNMSVAFRGYSRRHRSADPNRIARERYQDEHGKRARQLKAWARCRIKSMTGAHLYSEQDNHGSKRGLHNCKCCGCPASQSVKVAA